MGSLNSKKIQGINPCILNTDFMNELVLNEFKDSL